MSAIPFSFTDTPRIALVVPQPQHTRNLFGPIDEVAGKPLRLLERNETGDCLCLFTGQLGENIIDIDHRDVQSVTP